MVSAVFHGPLDGAALPQKSSTALSKKSNSVATEAINESAEGSKRMKTSASKRIDWRNWALTVVPPLLGLGLLVGLWALVSITTKGSIPSPADTWVQAVELFSDPFYRNGPNDQGVGWNVLMSLERVAVGFGLAAAVGIPAGFAIGRFTFLGRMFNPLSACCAPCRLWPGCPSVCWCSKGPTRPPSGPFSFAASGPWSSTPPWAYSACRRTT